MSRPGQSQDSSTCVFTSSQRAPGKISFLSSQLGESPIFFQPPGGDKNFSQKRLFCLANKEGVKQTKKSPWSNAHGGRRKKSSQVRKSRSVKSSINFYNIYPSTKLILHAILCFPGRKSPQNRYFKEQLSLTTLASSRLYWFHYRSRGDCFLVIYCTHHQAQQSQSPMPFQANIWFYFACRSLFTVTPGSEQIRATIERDGIVSRARVNLSGKTRGRVAFRPTTWQPFPAATAWLHIEKAFNSDNVWKVNGRIYMYVWRNSRYVFAVRNPSKARALIGC